MFLKVHDLEGHLILVNTDNVTAVIQPPKGLYPDTAKSVVEFRNGTAQAVAEDVHTLHDMLNGGSHG
jgi:hypothetical protein